MMRGEDDDEDKEESQDCSKVKTKCTNKMLNLFEHSGLFYTVWYTRYLGLKPCSCLRLAHHMDLRPCRIPGERTLRHLSRLGMLCRYDCRCCRRKRHRYPHRRRHRHRHLRSSSRSGSRRGGRSGSRSGRKSKSVRLRRCHAAPALRLTPGRDLVQNDDPP